MQKFCDNEGIESAPISVLCNVHPVMLFQRKIKELCQDIHEMIRKKKIKKCFLVDVEFHSESFVVKSLKCLSSFINAEYSAKPWNKHSYFGDHIKPKKNMSLSLKDHRFNRLQDCCLALLYHLDDIADYLNENLHIINDINILDRSFIETKLLKPIYAAISLLGLHITRPFRELIIDTDTTYSLLLSAFPKLYDDLKIPTKEYLSTKQVVSFV